MAARRSYHLAAIDLPLAQSVVLYTPVLLRRGYKALEFDHKDPLTHYALGNCLYATNQLADAIASYRKAIELDPNLAVAHCNLGIVLRQKNRADDAIACYRKAIECDPKLANAHLCLGNALAENKQLGDAIACYRKAIDLDPMVVQAHLALGNALFARNQLDDAIACYRKAIELDRRFVQAHVNLGAALLTQEKWDAAITAFRQALKYYPQFAIAHLNLGIAHYHKGQFGQAKASTQRALELFAKNDALRSAALAHLERCDRLLALDAKLQDVLAGKVKPKDNKERLDFIEVCRLQQRHSAAARLSADAFAADSKLADDLAAAHRYNAACFAALAGAGKGSDAATLDDKERDRLRQQALGWLRADLNLWAKLVASGDVGPRRMTRALGRWQKDADLAGVRDAEALKKLPAEQRAGWAKLWADVAELLKKADDAR
jgi:tetratricopeptide (TPR) repeat protein